MGWELGNPNPTPEEYDWGGIDARMEFLGPDDMPVITLCAAPDWMKVADFPLDDPDRYYPDNNHTNWDLIEKAPLPEHYGDFAHLAAEVARRYPAGCSTLTLVGCSTNTNLWYYGMNKAELLRKFLTNQCTAEELDQLITGLKSDSPHEYETMLHQWWEIVEPELPWLPADQQRLRAEVHRKLSSVAMARRVRVWHYTVAAGVILVLTLIQWWYAHPTVRYATGYGEVRSVVLPDSSVVTLNGNSSLSYQAHWQDAEEREVYLTGEAFFEVKKQTTPAATARTFVVRTDRLNVVVVGTTFNVNDRGQAASVVLTSGQVRLSQRHHRPDTVVMVPGQQASVPSEGHLLSLQAVDAEVYTAWKDGRWVFRRTPLRQIAQMLQTTYGLNVTITRPAIGQRIFTGKIPSRDVNVLLTILAESMQLTVTRDGSHVRISP